MILGLCDRWHQTPDVIEALDADRLLRLLNTVRLAAGADEAPGVQGG